MKICEMFQKLKGGQTSGDLAGTMRASVIKQFDATFEVWVAECSNTTGVTTHKTTA
jgi:hypothetical protein